LRRAQCAVAEEVDEMSNNITVVGNLTREPELRYTPSGAAVVKFGIAVNRFYTNRSGEKVEQTDFFNCNAWRQLAENIAESLTTGARVIVSGRLQSRSWETEEGQKRTMVEIEADEVGPSLRWATAAVTKAARGGPGDWQTEAGTESAPGGASETREEEPVGS
jgi:single-strand DNA-binding protein